MMLLDSYSLFVSAKCHVDYHCQNVTGLLLHKFDYINLVSNTTYKWVLKLEIYLFQHQYPHSMSIIAIMSMYYVVKKYFT